MESKGRQPSQLPASYGTQKPYCSIWMSLLAHRMWFCISLNQLKWLLFLLHDYTFPLLTLASILVFIWVLLQHFSPLLRLLWACSSTASSPGYQVCAWHSLGQAHTARDRLTLCLQMSLHILLGHVTNLGYDSDTHVMGTLLFRGEKLSLPSLGEIKTTRTITGPLRYLLPCYYFMQLIAIKCLQVRWQVSRQSDPWPDCDATPSGPGFQGMIDWTRSPESWC